MSGTVLKDTLLTPQLGDACSCVRPTPFLTPSDPTRPASMHALQATLHQKLAEYVSEEPVLKPLSTTIETSKTTNVS